MTTGDQLPVNPKHLRGLSSRLQPLTMLVGLAEAAILAAAAGDLQRRRPSTLAAWAGTIKARCMPLVPRLLALPVEVRTNTL